MVWPGTAGCGLLTLLIARSKPVVVLVMVWLLGMGVWLLVTAAVFVITVLTGSPLLTVTPKVTVIIWPGVNVAPVTSAGSWVPFVPAVGGSS